LPNDHNFGSLIMLAVTAGGFLLVTWAIRRCPLRGSHWVRFGSSIQNSRSRHFQ
jgi:hypothetical protein